eukprot:TRINITY_DN91967_c0_g1_i1.p1 TRINITY_DN91967_c0_g1~~TRINITY_DN91967_c0_g1_i1.p1  ORF type:complete len:104 (-),score=16.80 TRINITY_DN91967_c0_g1_i1:6-317(-)
MFFLPALFLPEKCCATEDIADLSVRVSDKLSFDEGLGVTSTYRDCPEEVIQKYVFQSKPALHTHFVLQREEDCKVELEPPPLEGCFEVKLLKTSSIGASLYGR